MRVVCVAETEGMTEEAMGREVQEGVTTTLEMEAQKTVLNVSLNMIIKWGIVAATPGTQGEERGRKEESRR